MCLLIFTLILISRLSSFLTESHVYFVSNINKDECYERNTECVRSFRLFVDDLFPGDTQVIKLYFDFLIENDYIYNDQLGMPLYHFREFLNIISIAKNVNISLKLDCDLNYVVDSIYTSESSNTSVDVLYDKNGFVWKSEKSLKNTVVNKRLPYSIMIKWFCINRYVEKVLWFDDGCLYQLGGSDLKWWSCDE